MRSSYNFPVWLALCYVIILSILLMLGLDLLTKPKYFKAREAARQAWYDENNCQPSHYIGGRPAQRVYVCNGVEFLWHDMPHPGVKALEDLGYMGLVRTYL